MEEDKLLVETLLVQEGVLTQEQVDMAKSYLRIDRSLQLAEVITNLKLASETDILRVLCTAFGFPAESIVPSPKIKDLESIKNFKYGLSRQVAISRNQAIIEVDEPSKKVVIAMNKLTDSVARRRTEENLVKYGYQVEFIFTTKLSLSFIQKQIYEEDKQYQHDLEKIILDGHYGENLKKMLSLIVEWAALENASDIFFVYVKNEFEFSTVWFKKNRKKIFALAMPFDAAEKLASYIETQSGMEAGKIMGHQDGALSVRILDESYTISSRLNRIATITGFQYAFRIQKEDQIPLEELGFRAEDTADFRRLITPKKGIVVLSGVTGSGKTTTLYSLIENFSPDENNILTMEDPVEIPKRGWNQIQINNDGGQSFSDSIRASLRQAPDIILFGEIRDMESAQRAIEASLTGHLVFCTIHASNVYPGISERLRQLGVENISSFESEVVLAIYQELIPDDEKGLRLGYEVSKGKLDGTGIERVGLD